jgi:hypothetical protein
LIPSIDLNVLAIVHPAVLGKFNHQVATARQSFAVERSLVALQFKRFPVLLNVNNDSPGVFSCANAWLVVRIRKIAVNKANRETVFS